MKRRTTLSIATLVGLSALTLSLAPSVAQVAPPPIAVEEITSVDNVSSRGVFTDDVNIQIRNRLGSGPTTVLNLKSPSRVAVARITVQPGAQFPWHTHHGPVVVSVVHGQLVYVHANDCVERTYDEETAFIDPGRGNVHTALNRSDEVTVLAATFFEAPASGPLTLPVAAPNGCDATVGTRDDH
jgi:quercetin dioxygenase-like cupin family protein